MKVSEESLSMVPDPIVVGLTLCEQVIVDRQTRRPSAINLFSKLSVPTFPSGTQGFSVMTALTGGSGDGTLELFAVSLKSGERIYSQSASISFPDRVAVVKVSFRVRTLVFPEAGWYDFYLQVDGHTVAQRRFQVAEQ